MTLPPDSVLADALHAYHPVSDREICTWPLDRLNELARYAHADTPGVTFGVATPQENAPHGRNTPGEMC